MFVVIIIINYIIIINIYNKLLIISLLLLYNNSESQHTLYHDHQLINHIYLSVGSLLSLHHSDTHTVTHWLAVIVVTVLLQILLFIIVFVEKNLQKFWSSYETCANDDVQFSNQRVCIQVIIEKKIQLHNTQRYYYRETN